MGPGALPVRMAADIAASFQRAVAEVLADRAAHAMAMMRRAGAQMRGCWWSPAGWRRTGRCGRRWRRRPTAHGFRAGGAAGAAVHRQRGDGRLDRDRAAAAGAGGWAGFRAAARDGRCELPPRLPCRQLRGLREARGAGVAAARAATQAGAVVRAGHTCRRSAATTSRPARPRAPASGGTGIARLLEIHRRRWRTMWAWCDRLACIPARRRSRARCCGRTIAWRAANCIPRTPPRCAAASPAIARSRCIIATRGRRWAACCRRRSGAAWC